MRRDAEPVSHLHRLLLAGEFVVTAEMQTSDSADPTAIVRDAETRGISYYRAESAELGCGHGEIGSVLALHWLLPDPMVAAIRWHHHPRRAPHEHRWTVRVIHLADHLTGMR